MIIGAGLLLFLGAYFVLPQALVADRTVSASKDLKEPDRSRLELQAQHDEDKLRNDVRTTAVQALGGIVLLFGSVFTLRTLLLNRQVHITDTFSTAIAHLQEDKLVARLGGIHALERVAAMTRYDQATVVEVLSQFVREHAPRGGTSQTAVDQASVQAAVTALGRLDRDRDPEQQRLDLTMVDLQGLPLRRADLRRANLTGSDLRAAQLFNARLDGALLVGTDLRGAALAGAECEGANFEVAHLEGADHATARSLDAKTAHCVDPDRPHIR